MRVPFWSVRSTIAAVRSPYTSVPPLKGLGRYPHLPPTMPLKRYAWTKNGQKMEGLITAKEMLKSLPEGAYTTARTVNQHEHIHVFQHDFHIKRLWQSMVEMQAAHSNAIEQQDENSFRLFYDKVDSLVGSALSDFKAKLKEDADDLRFTILVTWSPHDTIEHDDDKLPLNFYMQVEPLPPVAAPPVIVELRGKARENATAKNSKWVTERGPLEAASGANVNEILLENDNGAILEGSQSNFFAVKDGKVYTAGSGVLKGTVRDTVLKVCEAEGIPVVLEPPFAADVSDWEGAFVTSTSRLVLPIDVVSLPLLDTPTEHHMPGHGLVHQIRDLVLANMQSDSKRVASLIN